MKTPLFLLLILLIVAGCSKETDYNLLDNALENEVIVRARAIKVNLCHVDNEGNWNSISVGANAVSGHLDHGDVLLVDNDGDGWVEAINECVPGGDCDDANPEINPGAIEIIGDGIDNNCDGISAGAFNCDYFTVAEVVSFGNASYAFYNFRLNNCLVEDSILILSESLGAAGLSYDIATYGDTLLVDVNGNVFFGLDTATLNDCEDVLLAAQAILNLQDLCDVLSSNLVPPTSEFGALLLK